MSGGRRLLPATEAGRRQFALDQTLTGDPTQLSEIATMLMMRMLIMRMLMIRMVMMRMLMRVNN